MTRLTISLLSIVLFLSSCDKLHKPVAKTEKSASFADQIRISSESKPEIVAAFKAINAAAIEHNRVLLQSIEANKPSNDLAYSAGLTHLDASSRACTGLAKQIIYAVAVTCVYEKSLFVPFDSMPQKIKAMPAWAKSPVLERRGYVQIIDQGISTYDGAIAYLERGEEPHLRRNFDKQGVPKEVTEEFLRLRRLGNGKIHDSNLGMFREQQAALQSIRDALASATDAIAQKNLAEAGKHEQKAKEFERTMVAAIREQFKAGTLF